MSTGPSSAQVGWASSVEATSMPRSTSTSSGCWRSAVATASVISMAVFGLWLQKDSQAVLFTNLTPEDASVALEELVKQDVNAELANGGTSILVPET